MNDILSKIFHVTISLAHLFVPRIIQWLFQGLIIVYIRESILLGALRSFIAWFYIYYFDYDWEDILSIIASTIVLYICRDRIITQFDDTKHIPE